MGAYYVISQILGIFHWIKVFKIVCMSILNDVCTVYILQCTVYILQCTYATMYIMIYCTLYISHVGSHTQLVCDNV